MSYRLDFSTLYSYTKQSAITLPITLLSGLENTVDFSAKLDTGSTFCVFEKKYADWLDIELTAGTPLRMTTATGSFQTYGHELTLIAFGYEWQAIVYFAESETFSLNVLGRVGFLDRFRLGIVDYEERLYLELYS